MSAKEIVIWPAKVLQTATRPVTDFGEPLQALLARMDAAVRDAEGVGIAANQIGVDLRVALVGREDGTFFEIVNPELKATDGKIKLREGCLSVPDEWDEAPRFQKISVRYQDRDAKWHEVEAEGRLAHVFQHEIDHLDGRVFVDLLSPLKKGLIRERMVKLQKFLKKKSESA